MDRELIDKAWRCLPREFKEEVKRKFQLTDADCIAYEILIDLFGLHNLTSDAEGDDEMLCVSRKDMQFYYQYYKIKRESESSAEQKAYYKGRTKVLLDLFGSKCLPDGNEDNFASKEQEHDYTPNECTHPNKENCRWKDKSLDCNLKNGCYYEPKPAELKFKVGDKVRLKNVYEINEVDEDMAVVGLKGCAYMEDFDNLEPYTEPEDEHKSDNTAQKSANVNSNAQTCTDDCSSPDHFVVKDEMVDNIIKDGFKNHNRLHIAAMAMAGLLANEGVSCFTDVQDLEHMDFITYHAFEYADKLIKKSEEENEI